MHDGYTIEFASPLGASVQALVGDHTRPGPPYLSTLQTRQMLGESLSDLARLGPPNMDDCPDAYMNIAFGSSLVCAGRAGHDPHLTWRGLPSD